MVDNKVERLLRKNYQNIAKFVLYKRKTMKLTQKQLAEQTGIKQSKISEIERGCSGNITLKTLARLAVVLDLGIAPFEIDEGEKWNASGNIKIPE